MFIYLHENDAIHCPTCLNIPYFLCFSKHKLSANQSCNQTNYISCRNGPKPPITLPHLPVCGRFKATAVVDAPQCVRDRKLFTLCIRLISANIACSLRQY